MRVWGLLIRVRAASRMPYSRETRRGVMGARRIGHVAAKVGTGGRGGMFRRRGAPVPFGSAAGDRPRDPREGDQHDGGRDGEGDCDRPMREAIAGLEQAEVADEWAAALARWLRTVGLSCRAAVQSLSPCQSGPPGAPIESSRSKRTPAVSAEARANRLADSNAIRGDAAGGSAIHACCCRVG